MLSFYPEQLDREMGCTEAEWLRWLPQAVGDHRCTRQHQTALVQVGAGTLNLSWQVAVPRVIGLISMPVLQVNFSFGGVDAPQRQTFMKRFDLYMQRGGG